MLNCIGNLQLLDEIENREKQAKEFDEWILSRHPDFKKKHLIPLDESLYKFDRFDDFILNREALIKERLGKLLG